jgi:hypothetical protein
LFKFVEIARKDYLNFPPPYTQRVAVTLHTNETPNAITVGSIYRVLNAPISINYTVVINIQGTVTDPDTGIQAAYSGSNWYTLPNGPTQSIIAGLFGPYHSINWRTGVIEFTPNVTASAVQVTYSAITNPRTGAVLWGAGIEGLTDGRYLVGAPGAAAGMVPTTQAGVPAYLNWSDAVGELRLLVND